MSEDDLDLQEALSLVEAGHAQQVVETMDLSALAQPLQADQDDIHADATKLINRLAEAGHNEAVVNALDLSVLSHPLQTDDDRAQANAALAIARLVEAGYADAVLEAEETGTELIDPLHRLATADESSGQGPAVGALTELLIARPTQVDAGDILESLLAYQQTVEWAAVDFEHTISLTEIKEMLANQPVRPFCRAGRREWFLRDSSVLPDEVSDEWDEYIQDDPPESEPDKEDPTGSNGGEDPPHPDFDPVSPQRLALAYHTVATNSPEIVSQYREGLYDLAEVSHAPTRNLVIDALLHVKSQATVPPLEQEEPFAA
jgi:hypothetical protein